jgi:hypothetical protein
MNAMRHHERRSASMGSPHEKMIDNGREKQIEFHLYLSSIKGVGDLGNMGYINNFAITTLPPATTYTLHN